MTTQQTVARARDAGCWTRVAWVRNRWYAEALAEGWGDDGHDLLEALGTALARLAEQQGALLR